MLPSAISAAKKTVSDECRVRVDGKPDVLRVGTHFQCEHRFRDQLPGIRSDHACAEQSSGVLVENQLGHSFVARGGARPAARRPGKYRLFDLGPLCLGLRFGEPHPGDLRVGVGDRWNGAGIECAFVTGDDFRREFAFVAGFVRQHRLADDVADRMNMRHVGAHVLVRRDEAAFGDIHSGSLRIDILAVGSAPYREQHAVIDLRLRRVFALEGGLEAVFLRFQFGDLGLEVNAFVAFLDALVQRPDQVAIGARNQAVKQFHHGDFRADGIVDRGHLQADDAAADHQQTLRNVLEFERAGRIHQPRIVVRANRECERARSGGDDRDVE